MIKVTTEITVAEKGGVKIVEKLDPVFFGDWGALVDYMDNCTDHEIRYQGVRIDDDYEARRTVTSFGIQVTIDVYNKFIVYINHIIKTF